MIKKLEPKEYDKKQLLTKIKKMFCAKNFDESEADWIVANVLNSNHSEMLLKKTVTKKEYKKIKKASLLRIKGVPQTKIFKFTEFYGRRFQNKNVLSPRPETELLVKEVLNITKSENTTILDVCTGSGAIAITLQKELNCFVTATDISLKALKTARKNNEIQKTKVVFLKSNMFKKVNGTFDIITCNPPYIKTEDMKSLDKEVKNFDPKIALDGGKDGYKFYEILADQSANFLNKNGKLVCEIGKGQVSKIKKLLQKNFEDIIVIKDYNKIPRIIIATKKDKK